MADAMIDEQAERAVLGACLNSPELLLELGELAPADFGSMGHQAVLDAMLTLAAQHEVVNQLSVSQLLKTRGRLADVGGPVALMQLDEAGFLVSSKGSLRQQVEHLRGLATRRRLIDACQQIVLQARDHSAKPEATLLEGISRISGIGLGASKRGGFRNALDLYHEELDLISRIQGGQEESTRFVKTGIEPWDDGIGGLMMGVVTFVIAQPSVGKSALAASMAFSLSEFDHQVALLSLEDQARVFPRRVISECTGFRVRQLMTRGLSDDQLQTVWDRTALQERRLKNLWIDDESPVNVHKVEAKIRIEHARRGTRIFFIDHLMEMHDWENDRDQPRDAAVHVIVKRLRDLAKDLDIAIVLNAHMRDSQDKYLDERNIKPKLQDIVGGRAASQKARYAVGLWQRPPPKEPERGKALPKPKAPKKATPEEVQAIEEAYQEALKKQEQQYEKKHREWERKTEEAKELVIGTVLKANEDASGHDMIFRRRQGLISKEMVR